MSQPSPAKQSRIERHLERQRGAGVRDIATSFGFSFTVPPPAATGPTESKAPPAKRRRIGTGEQEDTRDRLKPTQSAPPGLPVSKLSLETSQAIAEKNPCETKDAVQEHKASVAEKVARKRGRPRKDATKGIRTAAEQGDTSIAQPFLQEQVLRPRRQAAATARRKVTEGFIEEEAPIDKKRRDSQSKIIARGRQRSNTHGIRPLISQTEDTKSRDTETGVGATEEVSLEHKTLGFEMPKADLIELTNAEPPKPPTKPESQRRKASPCGSKERPSTPSAVTTRIPLAEAQANVIVRSISPQKSKHNEDQQSCESVVPIHSSESPWTSMNNNEKPVRRKRKAVDVLKDEDKPTGVVLERAASIAPFRQTHQRRKRQFPSTRLASAMPGASNATDPVVNDKDGNAKGIQKAKSKRSEAKLTAATNSFRGYPQSYERLSKTLTESALHPSPDKVDNEDVDWLFEQTERNALLKGSKPSLKRKIRKQPPAQAQEMDLDDLLSNITAIAPRTTGRRV